MNARPPIPGRRRDQIKKRRRSSPGAGPSARAKETRPREGWRGTKISLGCRASSAEDQRRLLRLTAAITSALMPRRCMHVAAREGLGDATKDFTSPWLIRDAKPLSTSLAAG